jgi:TIR domain/F5/8 type C domain
MKRVVFISHSSADRAIAERLCTYLERNGVGCWIAPRDVTPGKNYGAAIIDAIDECRVFVLILSSHSNKSRQVVREVERAASTDSVILPFRIEDVQPSRDIAFYVSAAHWLDAAKYQVDEQFDELLAAIQDWQKADTDGAPGPATPPLPVTTASVPAAPPPRGIRWLPIVIGAVTVLLLVVAAPIVYRLSSRQPQSGTTQLSESPTPNIQSAAPTAAPSPEVSSTPEPTASEAPTATPLSSATATPIRLKPGERLRPNNTPQPEAPAISAPPRPPATATTAAPAGPIVREVAASSQLNTEYRPNYAFDGNPATAWVAKGHSDEQTLFAHFKSPALVRSVSILNGDGRDSEHYQASNRIKSLRIVLSDGTNQLLTFKDEMKMQRFELSKPVTADWVKFEIVSVFPGKTKRTGISEITFNED